jgi:hypothetical protein
MMVARVGLVPSTAHEDTVRLHRAALVVSRAEETLARYGRAALGSLADAAGAHRLAQVGAVVVWGSQDAAVARALVRNPSALVVLVLKSKPRKDSETLAAIDRLTGNGCTVQVHTIGARAKDVVALDVLPGREVIEVDDLSVPASARTHSAPYLERPAVKPVEHSAPSVPRGKK